MEMTTFERLHMNVVKGLQGQYCYTLILIAFHFQAANYYQHGHYMSILFGITKLGVQPCMPQL